MPSETKSSWNIPTIMVSEDKSSLRSEVKPNGFCTELVGVDGGLTGGMRPFPTLRKLVTLNYSDITSNPRYVNGLLENGSLTITNSVVTEIWPITFRIAEYDYGYGFVYMVRGDASPSGYEWYVFIDYRTSTSATFYTRRLIGPVTSSYWTLSAAIRNKPRVSVAVAGRLVYVYFEGRHPTLWYMDYTLGSYKEFRVGGWNEATTCGPGARDTLYEPTTGFALGGSVSRVFVSDATPSTYAASFPSSNPPAAYASFTEWNSDVVKLRAGDYSMAYELVDSVTGRRSGLTEIAPVDAIDFDTGTSAGEIPCYVGMEIVYDSDKWDKARIYRSVRIQSAGGTYISKILHLEAEITLADYLNTAGNAVYFFTLDDKALTLQDVHVDETTWFEKVPDAATAFYYDGTMIISGITENASTTTNLPNQLKPGLASGEIRWSSLAEGSPEMFSPLSFYAPKVPSNEAIAFARLGPNLVGYATDGLYHIRKESIFIKVQEIHDGYGLAARRAVESVGSYNYFLTSRGFKMMDETGALESVRALNGLVVDSWGNNIGECTVAYDSQLSAVIVFNPAYEQAGILWLDSGRVSELQDYPFTQVVTGWWPKDFDNVSDDMVKRAMFLLSYRNGSTTHFAVYAPDAGREATISGTFASLTGEPRIAMVDASGASRNYVTAVNATQVTVGITSGMTDVVGLYLVNMTPGTRFGQKDVIQLVAGGTITVTSTTGKFVAGDVVAIAPIKVKWVGGPLAITSEDGIQYAAQDVFRVRKLSSIRPHFVQVDDSMAAKTEDIPQLLQHLTYRGLSYVGESSTLYASAFPVDREGDAVVAVTEGEGNVSAAFDGRSNSSAKASKQAVMGSVISPGIEIYASDFDFRIIGVLCEGMITASTRTARKEADTA